jgi:hypothetical protein
MHQYSKYSKLAKQTDIYSLIDCKKTIRFNQSTQARIQTILKGREVPLKKEVQNKKT